MMSINKIAEALGGEISAGQVLAPGPGHSPEDRSLSVKPDAKADGGFICHSFSGDDAIACRDYVRQKLGLPKFEPKEKKKRKPTAKPWSPIVARYVYRQADGTPYLQVCRTAAKTFFQNRWNGTMWVSGKPEGKKVPYKLPELLKATITTRVHITEGEKDADNLAALGFIATTNSEGAAEWTDDLNEYFRDRDVCIHEHNDEQGRKRCQRIARALDPVAKSVRIIRLPGLPPKGDVSDWLASDPSGARLIKQCESTPAWEPSPEPPAEEVKDEEKTEDDDLFAAKKKQADILIELASAAELFHDRDDVGYARFDVNGHKENWPIRSKGFKRWLARGFYESTQSAPSSEAMSAAMGVLEARAQYDAPEHDVRVRVAGHDGCIYIDLADRGWQAVEIDEDGWRVIDDPPVYFRRSAGMKPLPEPVAGGSLANDLRPLLNVKTDDEFVLTVAWLLAALRDAGPYPVLALTGEQGSAKSWLAKILRALIDPNSVPLRALPRNEHDIFIAARNSHTLAYDNASGLPDWLSDTFCRLATGGGFSTRELYTDQDEVLFGSTRPIILNGIDDIVTRPDLADRGIVLMLAAIADDARKLESKLWADFERNAPRILGSLYTAVAHGLKALPDTALERMPRMADFAAWIAACEGALWKKGTFMAAYAGNIEEAIETVLEADQIATSLRSYMDTLPADLFLAQAPPFTGTAAELLKAINATVPESQQKAKGWPKRTAELAKVLRRVAPPLRKVGIEIAFERKGKSGVRKITLTQPDRVGKTPSAPSAPSAVNEINNMRLTAGDEAAVSQGNGAVSPGPNGPRADSRADSSHEAGVSRNQLKNNEADSADSADSIFPDLSGGMKVLGRAPAGERCSRCGGGGPSRIEHGGEVDLWHPGCAERYFTALANPPVHVPPDDPDPAADDQTCEHCGGIGGAQGGAGRFWTVSGLDIWLHERCERAYYDQAERAQ
jgi:hypothetical protein